MRTGALLACMLLVAGCGASMWASVPVEGSDASVARLAGKWEGTFEGPGSSGKGVIEFELAQGSRYAAGLVTFNANDPAKASKVPLRTVAAADNGTIAGVMGPYAEPGSNAQVQTRFVGTRAGDTISGTFVTQSMDATAQQRTGTWRMTKKP